ncbi:hypothetical protein SRABI128_04048 [Microbacterium sp. Bi128]|nr:hypothetical protein SRABI128_04048 [Microbacterium sp. Bi128]
MGEDLDFHRLAAGTDHRGVQRLVHVELGHRDVVLEPPGQGVPARVHRAQGRVTVPDRIDQDAHAHEVVDVVEVFVADDHLLIDRVVVLWPPGDRGLDLRGPEVLGDLVADDRQVLFAFRGPVPHHAHDFLVHLGIEGSEGQILQLPLDGVHAKPVGQRREDFQRLPGLAGRGLSRDKTPRTGIVEPVGEFDHQDADVLGHRDDHLAHGLGLGRLTEADLVQLRDAVHQHGHFRTELGLEVGEGVRRVFDGVVQQGRGQRGAAEAEFGEDGGHRDGVGDVRVAALALLAPVAALGDHEGTLDEIEILFGVVGAHSAQQRLQNRRVGRSATARQPGKSGPRALAPAGKSGPGTGVVHRHGNIGASGNHQASL